MTDAELTLELAVLYMGGREICVCWGLGEAFNADRVVSCEELEESLSEEGSAVWGLDGRVLGDVGVRGENAPGRLWVEEFMAFACVLMLRAYTRGRCRLRRPGQPASSHSNSNLREHRIMLEALYSSIKGSLV